MLAFLLLAALTVPTKATINGDQWSILQVAKVRDNPTLVGWTDCKAHVIELLKSQPDADKAETLIHETMHALACDGALPDNTKWNNDDDDHEGIYWGAEELTEFLQDNPEIVAYVMAAGRKRE